MSSVQYARAVLSYWRSDPPLPWMNTTPVLAQADVADISSSAGTRARSNTRIHPSWRMEGRRPYSVVRMGTNLGGGRPAVKEKVNDDSLSDGARHGQEGS